jgi:hypothetical protein
MTVAGWVAALEAKLGQLEDRRSRLEAEAVVWQKRRLKREERYRLQEAYLAERERLDRELEVVSRWLAEAYSLRRCDDGGG